MVLSKYRDWVLIKTTRLDISRNFFEVMWNELILEFMDEKEVGLGLGLYQKKKEVGLGKAKCFNPSFISREFH